MELLKLYKSKFFKTQMLVFIISLLVFFIAFAFGMSAIDFNAPFNKDINEIANINLIQIQYIFVMILTPVLAFIPFVKKASLFTIFYSYFMAFNVTNMFYLPTCNKILLSIFVILSIFTLSLNIVLSIKLSNYMNRKFFSKITRKRQDVKEADLEIKEEIVQKRKVIIITFVICMILSIITLIITKFI